MDQTQEAGRTISAATASKLDTAVNAMKNAMQTVLDLLAGPQPTTPQQNAAVIDDPDLTEATFTQAQRDALASKGHAMPDGSYPITN